MPTNGDQSALMEACDGATLVFHTAGATFNHKFTGAQFINVNVRGTENLIKALLGTPNGATAAVRFMYTSSVTVYGYRRPGETITEGSKTGPKSEYSKSKLMAEGVVKSYSTKSSRFSYTILRLGTMYGPGYERSFFKVFGMIRDGKMRYVGRPTNHLTLVHVDDVVDAQIAAAESGNSSNKIYNITDGIPHTEQELFEMAARQIGVKPPEKSVNPVVAGALGFITGVNKDELDFLASDRVVDSSLIGRETGFTPKMRVDVEGAAMLKEFIVANKSIN